MGLWGKLCATLLVLPALALAAEQTTDDAARRGMAALKEETPILALQDEMAKGSLTSKDLVEGALAMIAEKNPKLHAVIKVNPDALADAGASDRARAGGANLGPLMGIPVLIKDNIESKEDLATTAGSLALKDNITHRDAPLVARLRAAGAIILGKTNLSEWANIRSTHSVSGWSAVGGLVANPHAPSRTACGSSSGSGAAVAADLAVIAVGTETDGSVVCPSSVNGIVGLKPTVGLVSRHFIVPISHSQDTAGPMGHRVEDVAVLLSVMAGSDSADPATVEADAHRADFAAGLSADGLKGVRIGVLRFKPSDAPKLVPLFDHALARLAHAGAILVDIADEPVEGLSDAEDLVLSTEFKVDLNAYLSSTPAAVKSRTLSALITFNRDHAATELRYFNQDYFEKAELTKGLDDPAYLAARDKARSLSQARLDGLLRGNQVSLLVAPTMGPAWLSDLVLGDRGDGPSASILPATSGYPHLTVPMGDIQGLPVGLSFMAGKWQEALLLKAGFAFEKTETVSHHIVRARLRP
jgi:amidase